MKILITGAHFTPAHAVIEKLKNYENISIVYLGRKYTQEGDKTESVESKVLPQLGIKFIPIIAGRLKRDLSIYTLTSLLKIPIGFLQSFLILFKENPDVVVSFGGYVAVPVVFSSWLLSKPILIHEQTLVSGLANSISSLFATKIAVTFDTKYNFDKSKTVITGNPMRKEILNPKLNNSSELSKFVKNAKSKKLPIILVTGGNQGAHQINLTIEEIIDKLINKFAIIHQTGDSKFKDFERLNEKMKNFKNQNNYYLSKWIDADDMGLVLKNVDLVISRGGINTLLELAYFSLTTIIIPLPGIHKNEQEVNAEFFTKQGLGETILQSKLTSDLLLQKINHFIKRKPSYDDLSTKNLVIPDASLRLVQQILILGKY